MTCIGCDKPTGSKELLFKEPICGQCLTNWLALTDAIGDELRMEPRPDAPERGTDRA